MNSDESVRCLEALEAAFGPGSISQPDAARHQRQFAGYSVGLVDWVIEDLIRDGGPTCPPPKEMADLLRTKQGALNAQTQRTNAHFQPVPPEDRLPDEEYHQNFEHLRALTGRAS